MEQEAVINKVQSVVLNIGSGFHTKTARHRRAGFIGDALDCNDTNQCDNCQDSSQTVENPFTRRYVDFQIVHRVGAFGVNHTTAAERSSGTGIRDQ